jgi:hypothetical protein
MESCHHERIQRVHVQLHPHLVHLLLWDPHLIITFICTFINIGHQVFKQHILLVPCRGVGVRLLLQELVISVYVHQVLRLIQCYLILHFAVDK